MMVNRSGRAPRRVALALLHIGLAATVVTGCTDDGPDAQEPEGAAELIARGLERRDLTDAPVTGRSSALAAIARGMPRAPSVRVVSVEEGMHSSTRTATLETTWPVEGQRWRYRQRVGLTDTGERWQATWTPRMVHPGLADGERLRVRTVTPRRADILGAGDAPLVTARPVYRIGIDRAAVRGDAGSAARRLADLLELDPTDYARSVTSAGPRAFVPAIVLRREAVDASLRARIDAADGAVAIADETPLAPSSTFAAPVLGKVGPATAEVVQRSRGAVQPDQQVGLSGLQAEHDVQLRGRPSVRVSATTYGADGSVTGNRRLADLGGVAGKPLRTTLDARLQRHAERELSRIPDKPAAIVVMRPSTGDLLALASGPGSQGQNTAEQGRFAPGSTFKVVSSLALLRSGLGVDDRVDCSPTISSSGRSFTNFPDYPGDKLGRVSFRTAVANSCNTAMIRAGQRIDNRDLARAAQSLGLTQGSGRAFLGSVPAGDAGAEHDASMIGQGRVLASPLGMATVAASVAAGRSVAPRILVSGDPASKPSSDPLSRQETRSLRGLMRAVVAEGGARGLASEPGAPVLAKTGTAEYGTGDPPGVRSWMIASQGDVAVSVLVQDGGYGGETCLPLIRSMLQAAR